MMQLFGRIPFGLGKLFRPRSVRAECGRPPGSYKLLPVFSESYCTGCNLCVEACDRSCLEMVWDFATLKRPSDCDSEGNCMDVCPEEVIRMDWVLIAENMTENMTENSAVGRWEIEECRAHAGPA